MSLILWWDKLSQWPLTPQCRQNFSQSLNYRSSIGSVWFLRDIIFYVLSSWRAERRAQFTVYFQSQVSSDQLLQHRKSPQQTSMTSKVKQRSWTSQSSAVSLPADWETLPDLHSTATESLGICRPKASITWMDGFSFVNICKLERKAKTTGLWCWPLFKFQLNGKGQSSLRFFFVFFVFFWEDLCLGSL